MARLARTLVGMLLATGAAGAAAQDGVARCVLCVPFNDAATYSFVVTGPGQVPVTHSPADPRLFAMALAFQQGGNRQIGVNSSKDGMTTDKVLEALRRSDVVCDGVSLVVHKFQFSLDTGGVHVPVIPVLQGTLCVGTVTTVNEFRERPYKKFFDAEKKTVLDRLTGIEQLASKDAMRATLKDLLDTDLKAQRSLLVGEVAAEAVRLLEQPVAKKK